MEGPEGIPAAITPTCSKCGSERGEPGKFCPRCGFPFASVFSQQVPKSQSLETAIKTTAALFGVNLLFLLLKVVPERFHLVLEIAIELLFCGVILFAVLPFRSRIGFLTRRFYNRRYPFWKMASLALATGAVILLYLQALGLLGIPTVDILDKEDLGTWKVLWVFLSAVVLAPVCEEIFFRGYLYRKFRLVLNPRQTIILQGLVFGIVHLSPVAYISHTMMGVLAGYLRYRTDSLLPGMLFHALWNLGVVGFEYALLTGML